MILNSEMYSHAKPISRMQVGETDSFQDQTYQVAVTIMHHVFFCPLAVMVNTTQNQGSTRKSPHQKEIPTDKFCLLLSYLRRNFFKVLLPWMSVLPSKVLPCI